jgi:AraC-like DNA-binding protein
MVDLRTPFDAVGELTRVGSCDELVRQGSPSHYATGDNLMMWCTRPDLCGLVLWGRMSVAELRLLERVFDSAGADSGIATPCDFVLDARRLHGLDSDLYDALARAAVRRRVDIQRCVRRQAVLRSAGLIGGAVSGLYVGLDAAIEWRVFTELAPALVWLDEPDPGALAARLEQLVAEAVSGSTVLDRLREVLAISSPGSTSLDEVSRRVGVSRRSLQRALHARGTSYRGELYRARVAISQQLLLETDHKIAAIGDRLGFSTEANFITFFRRTTGASPAEWRRRHRDVPARGIPPGRAGAAC